MWSKKKNQRKRDTLYQQSEEYLSSKKEKEYLLRYRQIAGEYLDDKELIDILKRNNFDDDLISKELNKIVLGDDFKWKEIKNGKPVTTRSTDQVRKKQRYYKQEKSYPVYEKTEEDNNNDYNKRKMKGSYHKNSHDFYHYNSKRPKRPFQKCIEVPSDYLPMNNKINNYNKSRDNNIVNTDDNNIGININSNNNNKIIPSKSVNNMINNDSKNKINNIIDDNKINDKFIENKNNNIKKSLPINMNINMNLNNINKREETKNDEKIISDEEQRKIILIKEEVFKNLKRLKTNTEIKNKEAKNRQKDIYRNKDSSSEKDLKNLDIDYNIFNQDIKNDKALRKKYLKIFFGNMNHYSKKIENNIKRANSKDSETSEDKPETIKRRKKNNIPTSSNIIQKKNRPVNNSNNSNINRNLRRAYEIDQIDKEIEFDSKVVNFTISSCYDNPYRDQYLKFINEKKKQNPGKIVELIIPQFNNMYMPSYMPPYQYPYMNQNMYMYPPPVQYQSQIPAPRQTLNPQNVNNQNNSSMEQPQYQQPNYWMNPPPRNIQINQQYMSPMNIPLNQQNSSGISSPMNSEINLEMSPKINHFDKYIGINNQELFSPKSTREINSDNAINNMSDN